MIQQILEGWVDQDEIDSIFEWQTTPGVKFPFLYLAGDVYKEEIPGTVFISILVKTADTEPKREGGGE